MADRVIPAAPQAEFETRERCFVTEVVNAADVPSFSLARARVEPGVTTELHALDVDEWYVIERGAGLVEVDREPAVAVAEGDVVPIPRGTPQRITNPGDEDLVILCVCLPRFTAEGYSPLE